MIRSTTEKNLFCIGKKWDKIDQYLLENKLDYQRMFYFRKICAFKKEISY